MARMVNGESEPMPPIVRLNHPYSFDVWKVWVATGRRHLPSQILQEPEALLADVLSLDARYREFEEQIKK